MRETFNTDNMTITVETDYELPYGNQPKLKVYGTMTYRDSVDTFTRAFKGVLKLVMYGLSESQIRLEPFFEWEGEENDFYEYGLDIESVEEAYNDQYNS